MSIHEKRIRRLKYRFHCSSTMWTQRKHRPWVLTRVEIRKLLVCVFVLQCVQVSRCVSLLTTVNANTNYIIHSFLPPKSGTCREPQLLVNRTMSDNFSWDASFSRWDPDGWWCITSTLSSCISYADTMPLTIPELRHAVMSHAFADVLTTPSSEREQHARLKTPTDC